MMLAHVPKGYTIATFALITISFRERNISSREATSNKHNLQYCLFTTVFDFEIYLLIN